MFGSWDVWNLWDFEIGGRWDFGTLRLLDFGDTEIRCSSCSKLQLLLFPCFVISTLALTCIVRATNATTQNAKATFDKYERQGNCICFALLRTSFDN